MAKIALIDDHRLFREGFRTLLRDQPDLQVVAEAGDAREAFAAVTAARPDLVVIDVLLPGMNGIDLLREMSRQEPGRPILALSMLRDEATVARAFEAGALGYACKDQSADQVIEALRRVARRERYLPPFLSTPAPDGLSRLTRREREVFDRTIAGQLTAEIALQLSISRRTVETHRARILRKLGAHSATDLVRLAARLGVLQA